MLQDPIAYPRRNPGWFRELALGTFLLMTSPLVIPGLIVSGYCLRAVRAGVSASMELPTFGEWRSLLREGWRLPAVLLAYGGLPLALYVGKPRLPVAGGAAIGLDVLMMLLALLAAFVLPIALARMVDENSIGAAFDIDEIVEIVFTRDYAHASVVWVTITISAAVPIGFFLFVPVLTPFGLLFAFYFLLVQMYLAGRVYGLATGRMGRAKTGRSSPRF